MELALTSGAPYGNRTRVSALRGPRPRPLDEGSVRSHRDSLERAAAQARRTPGGNGARDALALASCSIVGGEPMRQKTINFAGQRFVYLGLEAEGGGTPERQS